MSQYCHCKFSFDTATKGPALVGGIIAEAWICGSCKKAHHAVAKERSIVRGPADAVALLHADSRKSGIHNITWATPRGHVTTVEYHPYPRTIHMTSPEPKLYELWELLQSKLKIFMEYNPEDDMVKASDREKAKNQARGIAEALAVLMSPFLDSADAVVRAAATYYKDNSYEVPGLGTHLWDPLYDSDGSLRTPVASARPARPRPAVKMQPKPKAAMSPADIEFAKQGLESGMFSKEDLASMFKVSASDIEAAIA